MTTAQDSQFIVGQLIRVTAKEARYLERTADRLRAQNIDPSWVESLENSDEHSEMLDTDVAVIYGVETKRINEAVKNNPDKFPDGYVMVLDKNEWDSLKSKFSTSIKGGKVKLPSAFTEKACSMLATILKSPHANGII